MMPDKAGRIILSALLAMASVAPAHPADARKHHDLHEPSEIMKVMESSTLTYELGIDESLPAMTIESPRVLSDHLLLVEAGDNYTLTTYSLSEEGKSLLEAAEDAYERKDYGKALEEYARLEEREPEYGHVSVLIGDVHYSRGDFDKARRDFEKAIKRNFADYQAHWFLGDAKWQMGDKQRAIRSLTTAHLLNVNHKTLREKLLSYRAQTERPWKSWTYEPRYEVKKEADKIKVRFAKEWMGYAVVKAVWAFEPGYAQEMVGSDYEKQLITMPEEKEALIAEMAMNQEMKHIEKLVSDGFADEFILYELLARRAPEAIVMLPRKLFVRLVDYVDTYH